MLHPCSKHLDSPIYQTCTKIRNCYLWRMYHPTIDSVPLLMCCRSERPSYAPRRLSFGLIKQMYFAKSRSSGQEIPHLWKPRIINVFTTAHHCPSPILSHMKYVRILRPLLKSILILSSRLCLGFSNGLFPRDFQTNFCISFSLPPCLLHAPPISSFLILSPQ
jgi:hypothetical protein